MDTLESWAKEMLSYQLPRWQELPDFEIYMDQAVDLLGQYLTPLLMENNKTSIVTPTMINNYVKQNLILKPEKRKYNRQHLASIIVITILKRILTISEINQGIEDQIEKFGVEKAYDVFCNMAEGSIHILMERLLNQSSTPLLPENIDANVLVLHIATSAFAGRIVTEKVLYFKKKEKMEE